MGEPHPNTLVSLGLRPCVPPEAWSVIASPFLPKYLSSPRCAALQGALYLVGDNTKKVYVYDPGANLWQKVGLSLAALCDCTRDPWHPRGQACRQQAPEPGLRP